MPPLLLLLAAATTPPTGPVDTPVLARTVQRGEVIAAADIELQPRPAGFVTGALRAEAVAGREAARTLPAGAIVRAGDVVAPRLVRRGEPVTIAWRAAGLVITTPGRALTSGGQGELVRVVATATNRTLDASVEGSGTVRVAAP